MSKRLLIVLIGTLTATLLGCSDPVGLAIPTAGVHPGVVQALEGEVQVQVPGGAHVGENVTLRIVTLGGLGSGVIYGYDLAETRTTMTEEGLVIEPLNNYSPPEPALPLITKTYHIDHVVNLTFARAGRMKIEIRGASVVGKSYKPIVLTYWVNVTE